MKDGWGHLESSGYPMDNLCGSQRPGIFPVRCTRSAGHDRYHLGKRLRVITWHDDSSASGEIQAAPNAHSRVAYSGQSAITYGEEVIEGSLRSYVQLHRQRDEYANGSLIVRTETTTRKYQPKDSK